ncbi:MAG: cell division protein FtsA [Candidatus Omnitrophota bacterium]
MKLDFSSLKLNISKRLVDDFKDILPKKKDFLVAELGNFNLKIAYFCFSQGKAKLQNLWIEKVSGLTVQEKEKKLISLVNTNLGSQNLKNIKFFFILPEKFFMVRRITIPSIPYQEILPALKFKLKDEFSLDMEKAIYKWEIIEKKVNSQGIKQLDLIVSAVSRERIEKVVKLCQEAGFSCQGVYSPAFLLTNYLKFLETDKQIVILDIGGMNTSFMIFRNNLPLFLRDISFASNQLTKTIVSTFPNSEIAFSEAENIKKKYGLLGGKEQVHKDITAQDLISSMRSGLEKLILEIKKSVEYYNLEFEEDPIKKIYLLGAGSQLKGLEGLFSEMLNIEAQAMPFLGDVGVSEEFRRSSSAVHLPLLLSAYYEKGNNFLPQKMRAANLGGVKRAAIRLGIMALSVFYIFLFLNLNFQISSYLKRIKYFQLYSESLEEIKAVQEGTREKEKALSKLKVLYVPGDWVMKSISASFPGGVVLSKVELDLAKKLVHLQGYLPDTGEAQVVLADCSKNLRGSGVFKDVSTVNIIKEEAKGLKKIITFALQCELIDI